MTKTCTFCDKPIRQPIRNARKNGRNHDDWEDRTTHKKCFILNKNMKKWKDFLQGGNKNKNINLGLNKLLYKLIM